MTWNVAFGAGRSQGRCQSLDIPWLDNIDVLPSITGWMDPEGVGVKAFFLE